MQDKYWDRLNQQKNGLIREICEAMLDNKQTILYFAPAIDCRFIGKVSAVTVNSIDSAKANVTDDLANTPSWIDLSEFPVEAVAVIMDAMDDYLYPSLEERIAEVSLDDMVKWINERIDGLFSEVKTMWIYKNDEEFWKWLTSSKGIRAVVSQAVDDFWKYEFNPDNPYIRVDTDSRLHSYSNTLTLWEDYGNAIIAYLKRISASSKQLYHF